MLFLAPEQYSDLQENVFSDALLEEVYSNEVEKCLVKALGPTGDMFLKPLHILGCVGKSLSSCVKCICFESLLRCDTR